MPIEEQLAMELNDLYGELEYVIAPLYYGRRDEWIKNHGELYR